MAWALFLLKFISKCRCLLANCAKFFRAVILHNTCGSCNTYGSSVFLLILRKPWNIYFAKHLRTAASESFLLLPFYQNVWISGSMRGFFLCFKSLSVAKEFFKWVFKYLLIWRICCLFDNFDQFKGEVCYSLQLYWNRTSAWVSSCKFASYFHNTFS